MYQACIVHVTVHIQMDNMLVDIFCLVTVVACLQLAKRRRVSLDAGMASGSGVLSPPPIAPLCTPSQPSHSSMETQLVPSEKSTRSRQHQVIEIVCSGLDHDSDSTLVSMIILLLLSTACSPMTSQYTVWPCMCVLYGLCGFIILCTRTHTQTLSWRVL